MRYRFSMQNRISLNDEDVCHNESKQTIKDSSNITDIPTIINGEKHWHNHG